MKKLLATVLASSMLLTMAATSMAAIDSIGTDRYNSVDGKITLNPSETVPYGETIYHRLVADPLVAAPAGGVVSYDDVKSVSIKQSWDMNGSAIAKVEIVKKKASDDNYYYFLGINTKNNTSIKATDVSGKVELRRSGTNPVSEELNLGFTLSYPEAVNELEVLEDAQIHKFSGNEEDMISFIGGYYTVNTVGQNNILMSVNSKFNSELAAKHPNANLDFLNFNNPTFNRIGELTIYAEKDSFVYSVNAEGNLSKVAATYDEYEEAYRIKTRTLGSYVISDVELKTTSGGSSSSTPGTGTPQEKPNPGTGAIA